MRQLAVELFAVDDRHLRVAEHEVIRLLVQHRQRHRAVGRGVHLVTVHVKRLGQERRDLRLVVNHQQALRSDGGE